MAGNFRKYTGRGSVTEREGRDDEEKWIYGIFFFHDHSTKN
jgi:hypothetical protein